MGQRTSKGALAQVMDLQRKTGRSDGEVSTDLGYSRSVINQWRKQKEAPLCAGIAAEGLLRRLGKHEPLTNDGEKIIVIRLDLDDFEVISSISDRLGLTITEI